MPPALRPLLLAAGATLAAVVVGVVVLGEEPAAKEATPPAAVPLHDFDTTGLVAQRQPFCDRVSGAEVEAALGEPAATETAYGNGDRTRIAAGVEDVAHEFGCSWTGESGAMARAWTFAPPVTPQRAATLAAHDPGCTPIPDAPAYGSPSAGLVCPDEAGMEATWRGLFGDAWLACSLTLPRDLAREELVDRAGRWCVAVARAASTS